MLVYGVVVLNSQFVDPLRSVWREVCLPSSVVNNLCILRSHHAEGIK